MKKIKYNKILEAILPHKGQFFLNLKWKQYAIF